MGVMKFHKPHPPTPSPYTAQRCVEVNKCVRCAYGEGGTNFVRSKTGYDVLTAATPILLLLCLLMTACGQVNAPANVVIVTSAPTLPATLTPLPVQTVTPGVNPLTGLPFADAAIAQRRPMIVTISNAPALVRPQAGLSAADLVYEHYVEGGLTRFSAVFYSQSPERVGSIRSARLINDQLVPMYGGLLAFSGASIEVEQILFGADYAQRTYKGTLYDQLYWRDETIPMPHNMFLNTAALWTLAAQEGYGVSDASALAGMTFDDAPLAGESGSANVIDVRYIGTRLYWTYDPSAGRYARVTDDAPHLDANTGAQITAANVVILYADHQETDIVESEWNGVVSYGLAINLLGEGDAILFRDGQVYGCRWVRQQRDGVLVLVDANGARLPLRSGNTWFQVVRQPAQMDTDTEWVRWRNE